MIGFQVQVKIIFPKLYFKIIFNIINLHSAESLILNYVFNPLKPMLKTLQVNMNN